MKLRGIIWAAVSSRPQADEDKFSIPAQIADGTAFFAANDIDLVETLVVPGFSRDFYNLPDFAADAHAAGFDAPDKLIAHIERKDFDVFWCRDADRFGREQSLLSEIGLRIVHQCNARIYSQRDGWIDSQNVRMWVAMKGLAAAQDVDRLKEYRKRGIIKRAERGLSVNGVVPHTHRLIYDEHGDETGFALKPEYVAFYNDLAVLLLQGLSYHRLPFALEQRGHTQNGKRYSAATLRVLLHRPTIWGHQQIAWRGKAPLNVYGLWGLDASTPPPDGITMLYDTHTPIWEGALAEQIKAELRRRATLRNNRAAQYVKKLAGLIICDSCHGTCRYMKRRMRNKDVYYAYYICKEIVTPRWRGGGKCDQTLSIREEALQEFLTPYLKRWVELGTVAFPISEETNDTSADNLKRALATLDKRIDTLIDELSLADDAVRPALRRRLTELQADADRTQRQLNDAIHTAARRDKSRRAQQQALNNIAEVINNFWEQDNLWINQQLRALFGSMRIVVRGKEIIGFFDVQQLKDKR